MDKPIYRSIKFSSFNYIQVLCELGIYVILTENFMHCWIPTSNKLKYRRRKTTLKANNTNVMEKENIKLTTNKQKTLNKQTFGRMGRRERETIRTVMTYSLTTVRSTPNNTLDPNINILPLGIIIMCGQMPIVRTANDLMTISDCYMLSVLFLRLLLCTR